MVEQERSREEVKKGIYACTINFVRTRTNYADTFVDLPRIRARRTNYSTIRKTEQQGHDYIRAYVYQSNYDTRAGRKARVIGEMMSAGKSFRAIKLIYLGPFWLSTLPVHKYDEVSQILGLREIVPEHLLVDRII